MLGECLKDAQAGLSDKNKVNISIPKVHAPLHYS